MQVPFENNSSFYRKSVKTRFVVCIESEIRFCGETNDLNKFSRLIFNESYIDLGILKLGI
jgi:hypothetical protein